MSQMLPMFNDFMILQTFIREKSLITKSAESASIMIYVYGQSKVFIGVELKIILSAGSVFYMFNPQYLELFS